MSTKKDLLKKQIDELCLELGVENCPYDDKTSEAKLNTIIDDLEAQLPDEGDDEGASTSQSSTDQGSDSETAQTDSGSSQVNVLATGSDSSGSELSGTDDIQIVALSRFHCVSHSKTVDVLKGDNPFLEKQAALDAIKAQVAKMVKTE